MRTWWPVLLCFVGVLLTAVSWLSCAGDSGPGKSQGAAGAGGVGDRPPRETPLVDASPDDIRGTCAAAVFDAGPEAWCVYSGVLTAATATSDETTFRKVCESSQEECENTLSAQTICGGDFAVTGGCSATLADVDECFRANAAAMQAVGTCSSPYQEVAAAQPFTPPAACAKLAECAL